MTAHEWVDASGMPWSGQADDYCAICSRPPDEHRQAPPDLIDRTALLAGLRLIPSVACEHATAYEYGVLAAIAFVEDFEASR